jgi:hypothetical protein
MTEIDAVLIFRNNRKGFYLIITVGDGLGGGGMGSGIGPERMERFTDALAFLRSYDSAPSQPFTPPPPHEK